MTDVNYGKRLAEWRSAQDLTQQGLANRLGVSRGYIGDIEAGRSSPSRKFLLLLADRFGVSIDWILHGTGEPIVARPPGFQGRHENTRIDPPDLGMPQSGDFRFGDENFFMVKRMDLDVSAGHGLIAATDGEHEMMAFPRSWMLQNRVNPDLAVLVRAKGDSMAPTIPNGALILLDCMDKDFLKPGIFAFVRGENSFVKRLVPVGISSDGKPTAVKVISDNPAFPLDILIEEEIDSLLPVGSVRCVMTTL